MESQIHSSFFLDIWRDLHSGRFASLWIQPDWQNNNPANYLHSLKNIGNKLDKLYYNNFETNSTQNQLTGSLTENPLGQSLNSYSQTT